MRPEYIGLPELSGSPTVLEGIKDIAYDEMAEVTLENGKRRYDRVILTNGDRVVLQVFGGTRGISLENASTCFTGRSMDIALPKEMPGRMLDGTGRPIDALGEIHPEERHNINGSAIDPVSRKYPRSCIYTGIFAVDGCATLIRGQKLPILSGSDMKRNGLTAQIVRQARVFSQDGEFAIVFATMGVKGDIAEFFHRPFEEVDALSQVAMLLNLAPDPVIEHVLIPRYALTTTEFLAFEYGYHMPVVPTDMASYCETLREFPSSKGETPSREGFPAYFYSDPASLYEWTGMIRGHISSVTRVPMLTMSNNDITHLTPDLIGYIAEGRIVLDRGPDQKDIYSPIAILSSLSRLMKDGVDKGFTWEDHYDMPNQFFTSYFKVQDARSPASVIDEDELSELNKQYLAFGDAFERRFVHRSLVDNRTIAETLDLEWKLLTVLPRGELDRVDTKTTEAHYVGRTWRELFEREQSQLRKELSRHGQPAAHQGQPDRRQVLPDADPDGPRVDRPQAQYPRLGAYGHDGYRQGAAGTDRCRLYRGVHRLLGGQYPPERLRSYHGDGECGRLPNPVLLLRYGGGTAPYPRPVPPAPAGVRHGRYLLRAG